MVVSVVDVIPDVVIVTCVLVTDGGVAALKINVVSAVIDVGVGHDWVLQRSVC